MSTQALSLKERQRKQREDLILQAASEAIAEKGYDALSLEEVAGRVGISRAAIYLHFASKEDLVFALIERGIETSAERLDALLAEHTSPREKVRAVIQRSYGSISLPAFHAVSAIMHSPTFLGKAAAKRNAMSDLWQPVVQRLTAILEEGKRSGDFDPEMPTPLMVNLLVSLISPFTKHALEQEQLPQPVIVKYLCRYFLNGIAPEDAEGIENIENIDGIEDVAEPTVDAPPPA